MKYNSLIPAILILSLSLAGCGRKVEPLPQYPDWLKYTYRHFVFYYPANSIYKDEMADFAEAYERYLKEDCDYLAMKIPGDTIHYYIHDSPKAGLKLTGRAVPYSTENQIHWDGQSPFGLELARYVIRKMDIRMTDFRVLYDGLSTLLDYSNQDYHHNTVSLLEVRRYIPLDSLINDESYRRADSIYRNWEAASLVAFLTYNFGINRFKMLWQSTASFEESVKQLYGVDLKRFEDGWHQFARQFYQGVKTDTLMVIDSSLVQ